MDIGELQGRHGVAGRVEIEASPLGGPVVRLSGAGSTATVALQGAQVLGWAPEGAAPVLWLSPVERLGTEKPVRGGIPVCWPWFATHPSDPGRPNHGFVRTRPWSIVSTAGEPAASKVVLATATTEADRALWPHAAEVTLEAVAGAALSLSLTTRNIGADAFPLAQALHSYLAVQDIAHVRVEGLDGLTYVDKVAANARKRWSGPVRFAGEVDRIYLGHEGPATIVDEGAGRRIVIEKSGSRSTVVWNPWAERCRQLGDMGADGYRGMLCVETANACDDVVTLAPGAEHTLGARIHLS
jgi:glucose-6-phosphate 1-epimerase